MKKHFAAALLLILSVTVIPALPAAMGKGSVKEAGSITVLPVKSPLPSSSSADIPTFSDKPYKVLDTESGQVMEVPPSGRSQRLMMRLRMRKDSI